MHFISIKYPTPFLSTKTLNFDSFPLTRYEAGEQVQLPHVTLMVGN